MGGGPESWGRARPARHRKVQAKKTYPFQTSPLASFYRRCARFVVIIPRAGRARRFREYASRLLSNRFPFVGHAIGVGEVGQELMRDGPCQKTPNFAKRHLAT
jgi:hypothetical protein